jgi:hypothetical protein
MMEPGVHFADFAVEPRPVRLGETLAETARTAEAGGCAWITITMPAPEHQPRPPIMIGGTGERHWREEDAAAGREVRRRQDADPRSLTLRAAPRLASRGLPVRG